MTPEDYTIETYIGDDYGQPNKGKIWWAVCKCLNLKAHGNTEEEAYQDCRQMIADLLKHFSIHGIPHPNEIENN